jgi:hypothetical protein
MAPARFVGSSTTPLDTRYDVLVCLDGGQGYTYSLTHPDQKQNNVGILLAHDEQRYSTKLNIFFLKRRTLFTPNDRFVCSTQSVKTL